MRLRPCIFVIIALAGLLAAPLFATSATNRNSAAAISTSSGRAAVEVRLQDLVEHLKARLAVPHDVSVAIVADNPLMVSVEAQPGQKGAFRIAFERTFIETLTDSELEAVIAHELGHVWIFTHHPFLQTEQLANQIAMRVVSRQVIEAVYVKVRARGGHIDRLPRFAATAN